MLEQNTIRVALQVFAQTTWASIYHTRICCMGAQHFAELSVGRRCHNPIKPVYLSLPLCLEWYCGLL